MQTTLTLKLTFTDGTSATYEFDYDAERDKEVGVKIEKLLQGNSVAIQTSECLVFLPVNNIKEMELRPSPRDVPVRVLKDARRRW